MRKIVQLLSIFLILTSNISAQNLTYSASDIAQIGDSFEILKLKYDTLNLPHINDIDPEMWNYSSILAEVEDTIVMMSKNDFSGLEDLPEGTMVMKDDGNSYIINYLDGNEFQILGLLFEINSNLTPMLFPEPQTVLHLPLNIGDSGSSNIIFPIYGTPEQFGIEIPFHDSLRFDITVEATMLVEDTGTVQTFQYDKQSFKVLSTTIFSIDLWALPSIGNWYLFKENLIADSTKRLQYYAPEYGIPVVTINLTWQDKVLNFQSINEGAQSIVNNNFYDVNIYPNPVRINQRISFSKTLKNIKLFDLAGKKVWEKPGRYNHIRIPDLVEGYYILKSEQPNATKRIVINR